MWGKSEALCFCPAELAEETRLSRDSIQNANVGPSCTASVSLALRDVFRHFTLAALLSSFNSTADAERIINCLEFIFRKAEIYSVVFSCPTAECDLNYGMRVFPTQKPLSSHNTPVF